MKKFILFSLFSILLITAVGSLKSQASSTKSGNEISNQNSFFDKAYQQGRAKGIINDSNMTYDEFISLCKNSFFPAYLQASQTDSTLTFEKYIADDHYEVPEQQPGDTPTTGSANDNTNPMLRTAAHSGYSMKAGDILICYGTNSMGRFVGHAAIASSSNYIMEMPGISYGKAAHTSKATFFKRNSGNGKYVAVYRINSHPNYADSASTYAYNHMFKKTNPKYGINTHVWQKSPSYCSKYVYLAYAWGATKKAIIYYDNNIIPPHTLTYYFNPNSGWKPSYIHKITSY